MEPTFRNTEQNVNVTRMTEFAGTIVFSDRTVHQVKTHDPVDNTVSVLLGSGREGQLDQWNATVLHFYSGAEHLLD